MTPRERVLKAMQMEHPDRVPLMCQFSIGFMNLQLKGQGITPMELWLDPHKYAEGLMILRERFGFDGILVSVFGHARDWRSGINKLEYFDGREVATFADRVETYPDDDLPKATYFHKNAQEIEAVDIDKLPEEIHFIPASRDCLIHIDPTDPFLVFDLLDERIHGDYSIHGEITSPFDYLLDLLGYEQALLALLLWPEKCKRILERFTTGLIRLASGMCAKNIDAVKISSPFAGMGFISPDLYAEFELPYLRQLNDTIRGFGKYSYIHTCGHIGDRLELMKATGAHGLECLDPPPIGNVDLQDAFERIGSGMFIKGNIDPVNTLLKGTVDEIRKDVLGRLDIGMQHPGFILSSACSIAPKTAADHIELLRTLVDESGNYD